MISVVIPTRDRWPLAEGAVRSALSQQGCTVEVIVVDDGSASDPPPGFAADERVTLLHIAQSGGPAQARNLGLEAAGGEWVTFLDDDDLWCPHHLATVVSSIVRAGADWGYGGQLVIDADYVPTREHAAPEPATLAGDLLKNNVIGTPSCVVARTDLVREVSGFDPELRVLADWDLWLRMLPRGRPASSPRLSVGYRLHAGNMHRQVDVIVGEWPLLERRHGVAGGMLAAWIAAILRMQGDRRGAAAWYLRAARISRSPGNLLRAAGVLLGERAMRIGAGRRRPPATPDWLSGRGAG
jgi:glycosyltransferase involved in cell wall biosynthesis